MLVVGVGSRKNSSGDHCTAVTYNGVSLTLAVRYNDWYATTDYREISIWLLAGPATGANTVSVTMNSCVSFVGVSTSYTGVNQSSTKDASATAAFYSGGTKTVNITTVADNCWIAAIGYAIASSGYVTISGTQTGRASSNTYSIQEILIEDTNAAQTPAGSKTVGESMTGGSLTSCYLGAVSFAPAAAVASASVGIVGDGLTGHAGPLSKGLIG